MNKKIKFNCLQCGKENYDYPSNKSKFCNHKCYGLYVTGIKKSLEMRKNLSLAKKGKPNHKLKQLIKEGKVTIGSFKGRHHTKESKEKLSKSHYILLDKNKIIEMYNKGHSTNYIGKQFNVNGETILNRLKEWKIKPRTPKFGPRKQYKADDGHIVRSSPELLIDNWLFYNKSNIFMIKN